MYKYYTSNGKELLDLPKNEKNEQSEKALKRFKEFKQQSIIKDLDEYFKTHEKFGEKSILVFNENNNDFISKEYIKSGCNFVKIIKLITSYSFYYILYRYKLTELDLEVLFYIIYIFFNRKSSEFYEEYKDELVNIITDILSFEYGGNQYLDLINLIIYLFKNDINNYEKLSNVIYKRLMEFDTIISIKNNCYTFNRIITNALIYNINSFFMVMSKQLPKIIDTFNYCSISSYTATILYKLSKTLFNNGLIEKSIKKELCDEITIKQRIY